ncbi:MAG: LysR family transcriptional regulator [Actinomycetota bacterium]
MVLDRNHLELLRALTEHPTLRAAATSINLSPSAASRRLHDAERRVGVALTRADGRSLELTDAGRYLADAARDADRLLAEAEVAARWLDRGTIDPVRIGLGFHDTIAWAIEADAATEVLRTTERGWPGAISDGSLDLVVDVGDVAPGLPRTALADDRLVAVLAPTDPRAGSGRPIDGPDLAEPTYFASSVEPRRGFEFEELFRPSGSSPGDIVRVESAAYALDLVAAGRGVTIQPSLTVARRHDLAVVELARPIGVTWWAHHGIDPDGATTEVIDHLATEFTTALADPTVSVRG